MDVGAALRNVRERRGLSVSQVSRATKIGLSHLRSIENNQIDKLPGGLYLRGFLRAYAREVGLEPEDTVREYLRQFQSDESGTFTTGTSEARSDARIRARRPRLRPPLADRPGTQVPWIFGAALLAVAVTGYTTARWRTNVADAAGPSSTAVESQPGSPIARTAAAAPAPRATARSIANAAGAIAGEPLRLELHPQGLCWISATVDEERVVYRLVRPGERQAISVHRAAVLRVGDPATFAFSIDGKPGRPVGRAGQPVTIQITRQNYREFIRR